MLDAAPHYARVECADCKRHVKFQPAPWTLERALAFRMPYGRYKGKSMAELTRFPDGLGYLGWVARTIKGNPGIAARLVLESAGGET